MAVLWPTPRLLAGIVIGAILGYGVQMVRALLQTAAGPAPSYELGIAIGAVLGFFVVRND